MEHIWLYSVEYPATFLRELHVFLLLEQTAVEGRMDEIHIHSFIHIFVSNKLTDRNETQITSILLLISQGFSVTTEVGALYGRLIMAGRGRCTESRLLETVNK